MDGGQELLYYIKENFWASSPLELHTVGSKGGRGRLFIHTNAILIEWNDMKSWKTLFFSVFGRQVVLDEFYQWMRIILLL